MRHLDDVLQLARLLLDLGGEEERGGGDGVAVEPVEGVEHVEPLHVHDRSVDAQLSTGRKQACLLIFTSRRIQINPKFGTLYQLCRTEDTLLIWGEMCDHLITAVAMMRQMRLEKISFYGTTITANIFHWAEIFAVPKMCDSLTIFCMYIALLCKKCNIDNMNYTTYKFTVAA